MTYTDSSRIRTYNKIIEVMIVVITLSILIEKAESVYSIYIKKAVTTHTIGSHYQKARLDSVYHHAFQGTWPKDNAEAITSGFHDTYVEDNNEYIKEMTIENGAMTFQFKTILPDRKLTIRPAIPAKDPFGPIIWVCGDSRSAEEWQIFGKDHTNIADKYIHANLK